MGAVSIPLLNLLLPFGLMSCFVPPIYSRGVNGGVECAACTIVAGIFGQVAQINNASLYDIALEFCENLPESLIPSCQEGVKALSPLVQILMEHPFITPDTFCYGVNFCHKDIGQKRCHLFPAEKYTSYKAHRNLIQERAKEFHEKFFKTSYSSKAFSICKVPGIKELCKYFRDNFRGMKPAIDIDGDGFSSSESWRGVHWRGRDCSDFDSTVYPGRQTENSDVNSDYNCNGIWGLDDKTGIPWETKLCGTVESSSSRGIIVLGDSVGAHFHFPEVWFNPILISKKTFFKNLTGPLLDELDWPQYSFSTGYKNISESYLIKGNVDSIYLRFRRRNLCNHRDYQNVCRNGASSFDLVKYVKNIARYPTDKPATVIVGAYGNDVCNSFSDTLNNMTTTKQFYENMEKILRSLDELILPARSHVILVGLVDGGFIYDAISEKIHPIGQFHRNVRYKDLFEWFDCMQIGPCNGWMTSNDTIRASTSKRAYELSNVLKHLALNYKPLKISVHYVQNPLFEVLKKWKKMGRYEWELIEPVDGFHPNQLAQPLITSTLWRYLKNIAPASVGPLNPHNREILYKFGDQGGH